MHISKDEQIRQLKSQVKELEEMYARDMGEMQKRIDDRQKFRSVSKKKKELRHV